MPFVTLSSLFSAYNTDAFYFHTKPLTKSAVLLMLIFCNLRFHICADLFVTMYCQLQQKR